MKPGLQHAARFEHQDGCTLIFLKQHTAERDGQRKILFAQDNASSFGLRSIDW